MRRLLWAAFLALAFHSLLFTLRFEGPKAKLVHPPRPLTLSLIQAPAASVPAVAVSEMPEIPDEPPFFRPQPREEKPQRQRARPAQKPPKKTDPSFPSRQEPQDSSFGDPKIGGDEVPLAGPPQESSTPTRASLEPGPTSASTLDRDATPVYRRNPVPEYPPIGRKRGYEGTVILEVLVNREGRVADLRLFASSGYSVLDQAALRSVKSWIFDPGMRAGEKVEMWVKVPLRFQLE